MPANVYDALHGAFLCESIVATSAAHEHSLNAALITLPLWSGSSVWRWPQFLWKRRGSSWRPL